MMQCDTSATHRSGLCSATRCLLLRSACVLVWACMNPAFGFMAMTRTLMEPCCVSSPEGPREIYLPGMTLTADEKHAVAVVLQISLLKARHLPVQKEACSPEIQLPTPPNHGPYWSRVQDQKLSTSPVTTSLMHIGTCWGTEEKMEGQRHRSKMKMGWFLWWT